MTLEMTGEVTNVEEENLGDALETQASAGATSLDLYDSGPFQGAGGQVLLRDLTGDLPDTVVSYTTPDIAGSSLPLTEALVATWPVDSLVIPYPHGTVRYAWVKVDEDPDADDTVAEVPFEMYAWLPTGGRQAGEGEQVTIKLEGSRWMVSEVPGSVPLMDGGMIDPETLPEPEPTPVGDGVAPSDPTEAPTIRRHMATLIVDMAAYARPWDFKAFEVEVSIDGGTTWDLVGQSGSLLPHSGLDYGTSYEYRYRAVDIEGMTSGWSPASDAAYPRKVNEGGIDMQANSVTSEMLASLVVLSGIISAREPVDPNDLTLGYKNNPRVDVAHDGLHAYDENGTEVVYLPARSGQAPFFRAVIEALSGLIVSGSSTFRGKASFEPGSSIELLANVANPDASPTVSIGHDVVVTMGVNSSEDPRGMATSPLANRVWHVTHKYVRLIDTTNGNTILSFAPWEGLINGPLPEFYGAAEAGGVLYTLESTPSDLVVKRRNPATGADIGGGWTVDSNPGPHRNILAVNPGYQLAGLEIWVTRSVASGSTAYVRGEIFNPSTGALLTTRNLTTLTVNTNGRMRPTHRNIGGVSYIYATSDYDTQIKAATVANVRDSAKDFNTSESLPGHGLAYDGTRWWTLRGPGSIAKHTTWDYSGSLSARFSWYKSTATVAESAGSPTQVVTMQRFAKVVVTVPSKPTGADQVRLYIKEGAGTEMRAVSTASSTTHLGFNPLRSAFVNGSPPASSTFPATTPSSLTGQNGLAMRGDGRFALGDFATDPPAELGGGEMIWRSDQGKLRLWNDVKGRWESPVIGLETKDNFIATTETRTNVSYGNLPNGAGPTVWVQAPMSGTVITFATCKSKTATGGNMASMGVQVDHVTGDGSNTLGAEGTRQNPSDNNGVDNQVTQFVTGSRTNAVTGLTPGEWYRIQAKYKTASGVQGTWADRQIVAAPF